MSRCTGHCCKNFCIPLEVLTDPNKNASDGDFIREMLILKEESEVEGKWWATCKHFDGHDCTVYDQRPSMCREYPYGKKCTFDGCTSDELGED